MGDHLYAARSRISLRGFRDSSAASTASQRGNSFPYGTSRHSMLRNLQPGRRSGLGGEDAVFEFGDPVVDAEGGDDEREAGGDDEAHPVPGLVGEQAGDAEPRWRGRR